jgi:hypothetical protein
MTQDEHVTVRELHTHLDEVKTELGVVKERLHDDAVTLERRLSRIDKFLIAGFIAFLSPKIGGPDAAQLVQTGLVQALHLL